MATYEEILDKVRTIREDVKQRFDFSYAHFYSDKKRDRSGKIYRCGKFYLMGKPMKDSNPYERDGRLTIKEMEDIRDYINKTYPGVIASVSYTHHPYYRKTFMSGVKFKVYY